MPRYILIAIPILHFIAHPGFGQYVLVEDLEKEKVAKIKFGKELSVITQTDTLDFYDSIYNDETQEWEEVWTGYWYLSGIDKANNSITLWNNLDEKTVVLKADEIEKLIFKKEDRGVFRKILLGTCFGGIVWAAVSKNSTQSVAAISLTVASAGYLASTVGRTRYRQYRLVRIE